MINASIIGSSEALFIPLRMSLKNLKAINISGDMKVSMFVYRLYSLSIDSHLSFS